MNFAIEISGVSKSYGNVKALSDVSLEIEKGSLYGLIGPDGAGKSTLYLLLATLMRPDAGNVTIFGYDCFRDARKVREIIGYMPQQFSLYPDLSVKENIDFFASIFGTSLNKNYDLIAPIYSQLERFSGRRAGALSGGMKQKLALCCALIHKPRVLLLDEPTTGVDAVSRSEFWEILKLLKSKGMTIIVSTSYMDEASLCDRISLMHKGKIMETGTVEELISRNKEHLINAKADDMFLLLDNLKKMHGVLNCYTFGATLHAEVSPEFNEKETKEQLERRGIRNVEIYPAQTDIEDIFIKLMLNGERNDNHS